MTRYFLIHHVKLSAILFLLFLSFNQLNGQEFNAHFAIGANFTDDQLTELGSTQVGTRMGLNIGPGVSIKLDKRFDLSLEMLYSQNGAYQKLEEIPAIAIDNIRTHYVEAPISLSYSFKSRNTEKKTFYNTTLDGGLTYAQLFKHRIIAVNGSDLSDQTSFHSKNTLLIHMGATSNISESLALKGRGTLSPFGNWTLAFLLIYHIPIN